MASKNDYLVTNLHVFNDIDDFDDVIFYCDEVVENIFDSSSIWDDDSLDFIDAHEVEIVSNLLDFITIDHSSSLKNVWMLEGNSKDFLVQNEANIYFDYKSALFCDYTYDFEDDKHACTTLSSDVKTHVQILVEKVAWKATLNNVTCLQFCSFPYDILCEIWREHVMFKFENDFLDKIKLCCECLMKIKLTNLHISFDKIMKVVDCLKDVNAIIILHNDCVNNDECESCLKRMFMAEHYIFEFENVDEFLEIINCMYIGIHN